MNLIDLKVNEFINEVDSNSPAPGGGSVSALAASLGVGLSRMVSHLTFNKKKFLELDEKIRTQYEDNFITLNNIKEELIPLIDKDTYAFNQIMNAFKMSKETDEDKQKRIEAIEKATLEAIKVPYEVARLSYKALELVEKMMTYGNKNAISDIGVGCLLLYAGLEGALLNVKINIGGLSDAEMVKVYQSSYETLLHEGKELKEKILEFVHSKL
ncbi:cyclodeaminase/cyclohydrolase family protein [Mycoplasmatota bacterium]|nr:cyclodeaminase/cyclohydrolase family protein [Mycoplasmatota bacterium]